MEWEAWRPTYQAILADFGWDEADDHASALELQARLAPHPDTWPDLMTRLAGYSEAVVVGAGPSLEALDEWPADLPTLVVSADGATTALRLLGVVPAVVVTDLDGPHEDLRWAAGHGAMTVVHAHGHNRRELPLVEALGPRVAGSCQCDPSGLEPLRNTGGFTDGDRAVLLLEQAGVRRVHLVGFDLDAEPGRLGHRFDVGVKRRKLLVAKQILAGAQRRGVKMQTFGKGG